MADNEVARTPLFAFADTYVSERALLDPLFGTEIGVHEVDHLLPDFSTAQAERNAKHTQSALERLKELVPQDDLDRVAWAVMAERLEIRLQLERSGEYRRTWGVISSPLTMVRQVFELMDSSNAEHAEVIRLRLAAVRSALKSWQNGLEDAVALGQLPSRRHILGVAQQARTYATGAFQALAQRVAQSCTSDADVTGLAPAAIDADGACGELARWLDETLAPLASEDDRCGLDRYRMWYRYWNGAEVDVDDLYAWGWQELCRIKDRMWALAGQLAPDAATLQAAVAALDADEGRAIHGTDALLERLETFTRSTVQSSTACTSISTRGSVSATYASRPRVRPRLPTTSGRARISRDRAPRGSPRAAPRGSRGGATCRCGTTRPCPAITCRLARRCSRPTDSLASTVSTA